MGKLSNKALGTPTLVDRIVGILSGSPKQQPIQINDILALGGPDLANGQSCKIKSLTEVMTIAAAASSSSTIQLPAGAIILAVSAYVTVAVTTTTNFTVGDAGSAARYSTAAVAKAAGSSDRGTKAGAYYNASATPVVITPNTTPTDATGRVRITIHYIEVTPPTS